MSADLRKQIEYYLGDTNLAKDDFFRDLISGGKDGYVDIAAFLKCNKVKKMNASTQMIAEAVASSELLELNED